MTIFPNEETESRNRLVGKIAIVAGAGRLGTGGAMEKPPPMFMVKKGRRFYASTIGSKRPKRPRNLSKIWAASLWPGKPT